MERMANYNELQELKLWKQWSVQIEAFNAQLELEESQWDLANLYKLVA